jgi:hypothetical protein
VRKREKDIDRAIASKKDEQNKETSGELQAKDIMDMTPA